eukprot:748683-Hanusia_phi.AAC.3
MSMCQRLRRFERKAKKASEPKKEKQEDVSDSKGDKTTATKSKDKEHKSSLVRVISCRLRLALTYFPHSAEEGRRGSQGGGAGEL